MTRIFSFIALFFAAGVAQGQDLATRIPADAVGIMKINTPRFFESVGVEEFSQSSLGEALVRFLDDSGERQASIAAYGIALDRAAYMYVLNADSVRYTVFLWPISDATKLENTLFAGKEVDAVGGHKRYVDTPEYAYGTTTLYTWDERTLAVVSPDQVPGYFDGEEVAERYGLANKGYYDFYEEQQGNAVAIEGQPYETADYWDTGDFNIGPPDTLSAAELADIAIPVEETDEDGHWANVDSLWADAWADADTSLAGAGTNADTPYLHEDEDYTDWYQLYEEYNQRDQQIKDSVLAVWTTGYAQSLLDVSAANNILQQAAYTKALDNKAIVSAWIPDFTALYGFAWPELFNLGLGSEGKGFQYFGDMHMHVYADKDLRITSAVEMGEQWAQPIKRMYDRKINRRFFRYIDSESMLGMYGFATNTKAILEELPMLIDNTLGSINGPYQEETALATAIVSLLLDEAAIARALRGDGLFVLNGLDEREVPYTHYDWDEDYNMIEKDSVKTEPVPDFLFMLSSDDRTIYDRMVSYLAIKGHAFNHGRIVEVSQPDMPLGVFMAHHQGILFIGSSAEKLEAIVHNRYRGNMARRERRMLRRHVAVGVFNVANTAQEFDNEQLDTLERYLAIRKIFGSMGNMEYTLRLRGNRMEHEFVSRTPRDYPNAIHQIMFLVDYARDTMN